MTERTTKVALTRSRLAAGPAILLAFFLAFSCAPLAAQESSSACPVPPPSEERPWLNARYSPQCRADFVLARLKTLDDKFAFLNSGGMGASRPGQRNLLAEMGLVRGGGSDGPAGVARGTGVTAFPTPLSVAANFDPAMAARYGELMGDDFFAAGLNQVLGPAMDMARTWHFGRLTESFGEDPFLVASTVGPEVKAIQSRHVMVMLKHYAVYTQEQGRCGDQPTGSRAAVNEEVRERAIREIYLPGFRAAVVQGGAGSVMCSFPRIGGIYACENPLTLDILKQEWGFDGTVGPDFPSAQRSIVKAFLAGLDSGVMAPASSRSSGSTFTGEKSLRQAVDDGEVPLSRIDDLIRRRLVPAFRIGVYDHPAKKLTDDVSTPERRAALVDVITGGAVLLKDQGGVLPLANVKTLAIIGTQATADAVVVEQGSPYVKPTHLAPALPAIQARAGQAVQVLFAAGTKGLGELPLATNKVLKTPAGEPGVQVEYFANPRRDFSGQPLLTRTEAAIDNSKAPTDVPGLPPDQQWSARYAAVFTPDKSGVQRFTLSGSGSARLFIAGRLIGEFLRSDFGDIVFANVDMKAGRPVEVRVEYTPREVMGDAAFVMFGTRMGACLTLGWSGPDDLMAQAAETAKKADVAVVFVGHQVGEGADRMHLALPNDQDALIEAVAKVNPHTVVVLNTGGPVAMPWIDRVVAVLEMWLPGDSFGPAAAKLLFGDADPGGRLPVTFPRDESQGPGAQPSQYPGTTYADGSLDTAHFDEGIFIGYRYWDQYRQRPLFPFGYGLSYTTFAMKGLGVKTAGRRISVEVSVQNTGTRMGSEAVQVYLGFPQSAGAPPKQLKGFQKVTLRPGETTTVHISLDREAFQSWDEPTHQWATAAGEYQLMVGRSSRDIVYTARIAAPAGATK
jgi:beta-glucosidase